MTWDEFKELVDSRLAERGEDGSIKLWLIDTPVDPEPRHLDVMVHDGCLSVE